MPRFSDSTYTSILFVNIYIRFNDCFYEPINTLKHLLKKLFAERMSSENATHNQYYVQIQAGQSEVTSKRLVA